MRKLEIVATLFIINAWLGCFSNYAIAKVTRIEILTTTSYGSFKAGEYNRLEAKISGELSPSAETIPDLERAKRNERGMVEYTTRVTIITPAEPKRGNGTLLIDVPNRGRALSSSLYNSPRNVILPLGSLDQGTGFLQDYGFTIAVVPWELGYGVDLPTFTDSDGKQRYIEGAALPIVRDVAAFLSYDASDIAGHPNPVAGNVKRTLALGYSQTGRFLRSFLLGGYNSTDGRQVFAGMHILGAATGQILLRSLPGPSSGAGVIPTFADPEMRGVIEEPLAIADVDEQVRNRGGKVPRMVFVNTTTDYSSLRASLGRTGGIGNQEKPFPSNVRVYDVAGGSHALVGGPSQCKYPYAVLDWHPIMRSTLVALDRWVSSDTNPPPNELMPLRSARDDPTVLKAPTYLPKSDIQIPVPDQDGNATGGVRLPDIAAPLGQHAVQNPPLSYLCALGSGYLAFAKSKEEREAANDSRRSLAERYSDQNSYTNMMRVAATELEKRRLLLDEDMAVIINAASETSVLK